MKILVERDTFTEKSTTGTVYLDSHQFCWSLELPVKDGLPGSCIPPGTYPLAYLYSPKFGRNMPHLLDIPNRSSILIHWLNDASETEGCIGIGNTRAKDFIGESRMAFDDFLPKFLAGLAAGQVHITVTGGAPQHPAELSMQGDV